MSKETIKETVIYRDGDLTDAEREELRKRDEHDALRAKRRQEERDRMNEIKMRRQVARERQEREASKGK